ncbi:MAG TPA: NHL repeat-containing protein, partial [Thermoanaerobaculia bacterium]
MANARPSLLLNGRAGWRAAESAPTLDVTPDAIVLRPLPGSARLLADVPGATSMAVDRGGRIHLLDSAACTIRRFDPCTSQFETLSHIGGEGSEPRRFRAPHGIAISPAGDLFVADTGNRRVQVFLLAGLALREIRDLPDGEPWDVAVTSDCRLFVSDRAGGVIHQFDRAGHRLATLEGFEKPTAIAVDRQDNLYVVQEGQSAVIVVGRDGSRRAMTRLDHGSGAFLPSAIEGLEFDAANHPIIAAGGRLSLLDGPTSFETEGTFVSE